MIIFRAKTYHQGVMMFSLIRISSPYLSHIATNALASKDARNLPRPSLLLQNPAKTSLKHRKFFTIVYEYEKAVTFTLGKVTSVKEPGFRIKIPFIQWMWKADMRTNLSDLARQEVITRDNVTIKVDGVVQYRVVDPKKAICNVEGVGKRVSPKDESSYQKGVEVAIKEIAQLKIREELSHRDVNEILHNLEELGQQLLEGTQQLTEDWGVKLFSIRLKDIFFDESMTRAMAKRAEAERTAEAKLINAEADVRTAQRYAEASQLYQENPTAMRLRELEAVTRMASEPSNTTIIVPSQILNIIQEIKKS